MFIPLATAQYIGVPNGVSPYTLPPQHNTTSVTAASGCIGLIFANVLPIYTVIS